MSKTKKTCDWCKKDKSNIIQSYFAMAPIQPRYEKKIKKATKEYGPEWWVGLEKDDPDLMNDLSYYDQLTCTVGRGQVCRDCMEKDDNNYEKYRPIVKPGNDPYDMMKIVSNDGVESIEEIGEWFGEVKKKIESKK